MLAPARRSLPAFPVVIGFPGYTPVQLTAILQVLAAEAGLTLTPGAVRKAAAILADARNGHATGNARLAVELLTRAITSQAHRITSSPQPSTRPPWPPSARPTFPNTCPCLTHPPRDQ
jgi:Cdc6-like AAA superfamily ATPase